jgi:phospholipid transport system substrate-binding protein
VKRSRSRTAFATLLCAATALVITLVRPSRAAEDPAQAVRKLSDAVIAVLQEKGLSADQKRAKIQDIVKDYADYQTMSRLVLARNWKTLTDEQKTEFVAEFKEHLAVTYGKNVESYHDEKVQIVGERDEGRGDWTVQTKIVRPSGGADILVDYRLRQQDGAWRVIDLLIERVSLVANFRSQFQDIMANGGIDRLLKLLREKNARGESLKS